MSSPAAIYGGMCSGHGVGMCSSHHPGLGGGVLGGCPHAPTAPQIVPKPVAAMNGTTFWPPLVLGPVMAFSNVVINGSIPIRDQDIITPHPTPSVHSTSSVGYKCAFTTTTPAWHCTIGVAAGRETATGHSRKLYATTKSVWINGMRAGKVGDLLGDATPAFPCTSVVAKGSILSLIHI